MVSRWDSTGKYGVGYLMRTGGIGHEFSRREDLDSRADNEHDDKTHELARDDLPAAQP